MMVRVENGHEVTYPAIVTQYYAVIGNDRGTSVDEHPFAQHEGSIWAGANFNRDGPPNNGPPNDGPPNDGRPSFLYANWYAFFYRLCMRFTEMKPFTNRPLAVRSHFSTCYLAHAPHLPINVHY